MDRNGSYKESDMLFKIALDLSSLQNAQEAGYGSYGRYYSDKAVVDPISKQMGLNYPNQGLKKFQTTDIYNNLKEIIGLNIVAPLINKHTQLIAPSMPHQSMSSVVQNKVMITQHFNGVTGDALDKYLKEDDQMSKEYVALMFKKILYFIHDELNSIGIIAMDIHEDNFIIKKPLKNRLILAHHMAKRKFEERNDSGREYFINQIMQTCALGELNKIDFKKQICVFDFGRLSVRKDSIVGKSLEEFQNSLRKYKDSFFAQAVIKEIKYCLSN